MSDEEKDQLREKEKKYADLRLQGKSPAVAYNLAFAKKEDKSVLKDENRKIVPFVEGKGVSLEAHAQKSKEMLQLKVIEYAEDGLEKIKDLVKSTEATDRITFDASKFLVERALAEKQVSFAQFNLFNILDPKQLAEVIHDSILESYKKQMKDEPIDAEFKEVVDN
jgi:hypothetical protein